MYKRQPGRLDQVNPQEVVVDVHPAGMLCNEVGELAVNDVGNGDLLIAGAGHDLNAGAFNQTSGRIHYRQTGVLAAEVDVYKRQSMPLSRPMGRTSLPW